MGVARYIDFGLAFHLSDVEGWEDTNLGTRFRPKFVWQAPEIHAWRMMLNRVRIADGVAKLKEMNPEYSSLEHQFPTRMSALDALTDLFATSKAVAAKDGGSFIRAYGNRIDSWRLGLCMWFLWTDLLKGGSFTQTPLYGERDIIRRVLGGLTDFDPRTRWGMKDALQLLEPNNRLL
jgi:hypothetical protein